MLAALRFVGFGRGGDAAGGCCLMLYAFGGGL